MGRVAIEYIYPVHIIPVPGLKWAWKIVCPSGNVIESTGVYDTENEAIEIVEARLSIMHPHGEWIAYPK